VATDRRREQKRSWDRYAARLTSGKRTEHDRSAHHCDQKTLGGGKIEALQRRQKLKRENEWCRQHRNQASEKPWGSERKTKRELRRKDLALDLTCGKSNPVQKENSEEEKSFDGN
jgi:hypothetical protein